MAKTEHPALGEFLSDISSTVDTADRLPYAQKIATLRQLTLAVHARNTAKLSRAAITASDISDATWQRIDNSVHRALARARAES